MPWPPRSCASTPRFGTSATSATFYANRGLSLVLDALGVLPAPTRERLALHVFTTDPDAQPLDHRCQVENVTAACQVLQRIARAAPR